MSKEKHNLGKPLALVPAKDWFAMYDDGTTFQFVPVICWAPKEQDGEIVAVGLVSDEGAPTLVHADRLPDFLGFIHLEEIKKQMVEIDVRNNAKNAKNAKTAKPKSNVIAFPQRGSNETN